MPRTLFQWAVGLTEKVSPALNKIRNSLNAIRSKTVQFGINTRFSSQYNLDVSSIGLAAGLFNRARQSVQATIASLANLKDVEKYIPKEHLYKLGEFFTVPEYKGIGEFIDTTQTLSRVSYAASQSISEAYDQMLYNMATVLDEYRQKVRSIPSLQKLGEEWERYVSALKARPEGIEKLPKELQELLTVEEPGKALVERILALAETPVEAFKKQQPRMKETVKQYLTISEELERAMETMEFKPIEPPRVDTEHVKQSIKVATGVAKKGFEDLQKAVSELPEIEGFEEFKNTFRSTLESIKGLLPGFTKDVGESLDTVASAFEESNQILGPITERYKLFLEKRFKPAQEVMKRYGVSLQDVTSGLEKMSEKLILVSSGLMTAIRWNPADFIEQTGLAAFSTSAALDMMAYTHEKLRHELNKTITEHNKLTARLRGRVIPPEEVEPTIERINELKARMNSLTLQMAYLRRAMSWTARYAEQYFPMGRDPVVFQRLKRIDEMRQKFNQFGASVKRAAWLLTWSSLALLGVFFSTQWFVNMTYGSVEKYVKLISNWADAAFDVAQWMAIASYIGMDIGKLLGGQNIENVINTMITGGMRAAATFGALQSVFMYFVAYALSKADVWQSMKEAFEAFVRLLWENRDLITEFIKGVFSGFAFVIGIVKQLLDAFKATVGIENAKKAFFLLGQVIGGVAAAFMILAPVITAVMMGLQSLAAIILIVGSLLPNAIGGFALLLRVGISILPVIASFAEFIPILAVIIFLIYDATQGFKHIRTALLGLWLDLNDFLDFLGVVAKAFKAAIQLDIDTFKRQLQIASEMITARFGRTTLAQQTLAATEQDVIRRLRERGWEVPEWLLTDELKAMRESINYEEIKNSVTMLKVSLNETAQNLKDVPDAFDAMAANLQKVNETVQPYVREILKQPIPTITTPRVEPEAKLPETMKEERPVIIQPTVTPMPMLEQPQTYTINITVNAQNLTTESIPLIRDLLAKETINILNQTVINKNR